MSSAENKPGEAGDPSLAPANLLDEIASQWNALAGIWSTWSEASTSVVRERGPEIEKSLSRLFDPEFWKVGGISPLLQELQDVLSVPKLADMPRLELSMLASSAAMLDLFAVVPKYISLSIPVWAAASQRFQREAAERMQTGEGLGLRSPAEVLELWNGVLDRTLMEFNRSGEFAQIQRQLLRALGHYRLALRTLAEQAARQFDMPTRKEMTDLYRRMHEMQRELHKLRREMRLLRSGSSLRPNGAGEQRPETPAC